MARVRDVPCSGGCGNLIWRGKGCLPPGLSMCQPCRRGRREAGFEPCVICGLEFRQPATGRPRKTCSDDCLSERMRQVSSLGLSARRDGGATRTRTCEVCKRAYIYTYFEQRTCGRKCGVELKRRTVVIRPCRDCGDPVETTLSSPRVSCGKSCPGLRQVRPVRECAVCLRVIDDPKRRTTCSEECAAERVRQYGRARQRPVAGWDQSARTCGLGECSKTYVPRYPLQGYCDAKCQKRASRLRERAAGTRHDTHRKRAKLYGRRYEAIDPVKVYVRDGWVCQLCRKAVRRDKVAPHPKAPTLDHIIPMVLPGGDHVYPNVQLAHFQCNSAKGAKVGTVQLAFIG